jgi:hypothetical protein
VYKRKMAQSRSFERKEKKRKEGSKQKEVSSPSSPFHFHPLFHVFSIQFGVRKEGEFQQKAKPRVKITSKKKKKGENVHECSKEKRVPIPTIASDRKPPSPTPPAFHVQHRPQSGFQQHG